MDPIKEAMIKAEDEGLRVYCRRCGEDLTEIDHDYCIGPRAGHYCYGCEPHGETMTAAHARTPFDEQ